MCDTMVMGVNSQNRKRLRSDDSEGCFVTQKKTFVNQRLLDRQDSEKMKQIQARTIGLLFEGAKKHSKVGGGPICGKESFRSVRLLGGGEIDYDPASVSAWVTKKADRHCRLCDQWSIVHTDCTNCNLELCEYCGVDCSNCPEKICLNCVKLFQCESQDKPCCEQCKMFLR
ncbi:uncharacterized protein LOC128268616 [Anopheles cruzii]|uniref:uncharacterized protein LOC128268616 n=1 Tax=Anopheles cruzii TaxID=68878 RepID=UPI0022EC65F2|nr:uncharacterized protein LOC128268616 [Anopheles cruzii]